MTLDGSSWIIAEDPRRGLVEVQGYAPANPVLLKSAVDVEVFVGEVRAAAGRVWGEKP